MADWEKYLHDSIAGAFARVKAHLHKHAWSKLDGKIDRIDSDLEMKALLEPVNNFLNKFNSTGVGGVKRGNTLTGWHHGPYTEY